MLVRLSAPTVRLNEHVLAFTSVQGPRLIVGRCKVRTHKLAARRDTTEGYMTKAQVRHRSVREMTTQVKHTKSFRHIVRPEVIKIE